MSYLNGPRINFWGGGSTNVDTANNADNGIVDLVNTLVTDAGADDDLITTLRQPSTNAKGQNYYTLAGWNYYGDHQVAFQNAVVSSSGAPGAVATGGPLDGQPVYLLGSVDPTTHEGPYGGPVMVDLDPTSSQSTQIFVGGLQIGGENPSLLVRADTRCHAHMLALRYAPSSVPPYLMPGSFMANGTFQVAFPTAAIVSYDKSCAILNDIINAPGAIGIVLRFCMFEHMPGMSTADIQANYAANQNDANPSLGRIIGTIGPWLAGEPATCPTGRLLQNAAPGGAQGVAYLDATNSRLTLDLSSALQGKAVRTNPKDNKSPIGPNVDFGDLQIAAGGPVLATTPSLPTDYYVYGGVYDIPLTAAAVTALAANPITITSTLNALSITESPIRIFGDDRNIYIDDVAGTADIALIIRYLGGPLPQDTVVTPVPDVSGTFPNYGFIDTPATVTVPAGSESLSFSAIDNGGAPGFAALDMQVNGQTLYFINFRKYPDHDFSGLIASGAIPWSVVYENCLRYYYILFPAMSKRIPLNDEPTIQATSAEILKRLSPAYRYTTLRMPVTRAMSPGQEALLRAYLSPPARTIATTQATTSTSPNRA